VNLWFAARGRLLAVILSAGVGLYLSIRGCVGLLS
jgi:hypothetical protein